VGDLGHSCSISLTSRLMKSTDSARHPLTSRPLG